MTPLWTPDANAQALAVSEAIAAAREDGRRQERERIAQEIWPFVVLLGGPDVVRLFGIDIPIPTPDSPADTRTT